MNFKKKMRRGSLAALITLALTSSALAMPTDGVVMEGGSDITITDNNWTNPASEATITAANDGLVGWNTFNIGETEKLYFNIADGKTLVNQVTGVGQLSSILGTMEQTGGKGNLVLINPSGIYVGPNAVLNIPDLTLSALSAEKATDTERILKADGEGLLNVTGGHFIGNEVNLIGRKVNVADGVVFDLGTAGDTTTKTMLQVLAADRAEWTFDGDRMLTENITHNAGNDVVFNGTVNMKGGDKNLVEIGGATATATNAKFHDVRTSGDRLETTIYAASKVRSDERGADRSKHRFTSETTKDNKVTAENITADGESLSLGGGAVTLKNSKISVDDLAIDGIASISTVGDGKRTETLTAPDRTVTISNSQLKADEVGIYGGKVTVDSNVTFGKLSEAGKFEVVAGNVYHEQNRYTTATGNDLAFHGKVDDFAKKADTDVILLGNTVNLDDAQIGQTGRVGNVNIGAVNELDAKSHVTANATKANTLSASGANIQSDASVQMLGGTVTLTNTALDVAHKIHVSTGSYREQGGEARTITTAADQQVTFAGTGTYKAKSVDVRGGKVTVGSGITFAAKDPANEKGLDIVAGSEQVSSDGKTRTYTHNKGNDLAFHGKSENLGNTENDPVALLGSTVNLDGARIEGARYVNAAAAQRIVSTDSDVTVTASAGNALSADGAQITGSKDVYLVGGNVVLKNGQIQATRDTKLVAAGSFILTGNNMHASATKDNVLYLDHTTVSSGAVIPINGKAQFVNGTQLTADGGVYLLTGTSFSHEGGVLKGNVTKNNIVSMWGSKVTGHNVILAAGGAEVYGHSEVKASDELIAADVTRTDGSQLSLIKDGDSTVKHHNTVDAEGFTVKGAADVPPTPEKPVPPSVPDTIAPAETNLSEQDKENIATGKAKAQEALAAPTQEQRAEALVKTVAQLNEKVGTSRRQTAGVVVGLVEQIAASAALSNAEKAALTEAVVSSYAPVQEAKAEQEHLTTDTVDEAAASAASPSVAPVYPDETEAEDVVTFG